MKRWMAMGVCAAALFGFSSNATADDGVYEVSGTKHEKHAQAIFTGVFGQCRAEVDQKLEGVIALVFSVGESGRFGATSTFKEHDNRSAMRVLARCMGEKANHARYFPRGDNTIVGVKAVLQSDGELLMLGTTEAETLTDGTVFQWARKAPGGGSS